MTDGRALIDALRGPDDGLDRAALLEILPYGEDFLFVDRVDRLTTDEVEGAFDIPTQAGYLQAHFVDLPLMPGVLIGEGLAQTGSVIVRYNLPAPGECHVLALGIERARFSGAAQPGDTLEYRVQLTSMSRRAARLEGEVWVEERKICEAKLIVAIVDREELRKKLTKDQ